jgi:isopentenyl-diphosphate Delta-isomerase
LKTPGTNPLETANRKTDHIRINLNEDVQSDAGTGLDKFRFTHEALPEIDLERVDLKIKIFNKSLNAPILISSMVGGTHEAAALNKTLASAAEVKGIAMGLGSLRIIFDDPDTIPSFQVRKEAPNILLFANLGAIQLNYGFTIEMCERAVEITGADALILHLNPLQEALQPEGNTNYGGLLNKMEQVCKKLPVPVIVKEVGWGISEKTAKRLKNIGVAAIDVSGAGGTSWSQVEMYRAENESQARNAAAFRDWGISTTDSILQVKKGADGLLIFASGGLRNGIDIAKCIALGASLGGMAGPFLKAANKSLDDTFIFIQELFRQIQICMFVCGAADITQLQNTPLEIIPKR